MGRIMVASADHTSYDTSGQPARRRAAFWRDAVCSTFASVDCRIADAASFSGFIITRGLADLRISRVSSGPHDIRRAVPHRGGTVQGPVLVGYQRRGSSCVVQDGRSAILKPGQFALYDTARPYELHLGRSCDQIVLSFPAELAASRFGRTLELTARAIGDRRTLGQIASAVFLRLGRIDGPCGTAAEHHLRDVASSAIAANVAAVAETLPDPQRSGRALILMRSRAFIEDNLGRCELTSGDIAASVGVSVRYLQELFQADGTTLMSHVWSCRLQRARRLLDETAWRGSSISQIALACGFQDFSHFGRRFREAFGMSARELRQRGG